MAHLQNTCHPGFFISFDNIDLVMKRRNMTSTEQNQDFHWVNHKMVKNRVGANQLDPSKPTADILDVQNIRFLPNAIDINNYLQVF